MCLKVVTAYMCYGLAGLINISICKYNKAHLGYPALCQKSFQINVLNSTNKSKHLYHQFLLMLKLN